MATGAVKNKYTFHNLQPGLKFRVRIRAIDGEGNKGDYSDPIDIISGMGAGSRPSTAVAGLNVSGVTGGVEVTWNSKSGARGYEVYATIGNGSQADPDPTNKADLIYRGNAIKYVIQAKTGENVKVKVGWFDEFGWNSSTYASANGDAS